MYFGAPSLPYGKMGYVEDGDYASQAYEKDEYIIWKGGNYFAKTDILQGAEFVIDTNLTAIPDGVLNGIMAKVSALNDNKLDASKIVIKDFSITFDGNNSANLDLGENGIPLTAVDVNDWSYYAFGHKYNDTTYRIYNLQGGGAATRSKVTVIYLKT